MPVLREDVISRLRRLTAMNRSHQQSIQDANQLTDGPFEVQADNGTVMQVEPWWSNSCDREFEDAGAGGTFTVSGGSCTCPEFQRTGTCVHLQAAEFLTTGTNGPGPGHVIETLPVPPAPLSFTGESRVPPTLRYRISTDTENTYTITNGRCDCPDFIHTGACVHVQAAELVQTGATGPESVETVTINAGDAEAPIENNTREREADRQRSRRRNRLEVWQERHEDGVWLSRDDDAFKQLFTAVKTGSSLEYEHEDVLVGSENSFGIEIEFVGGDLNVIARALGEVGLGTGYVSGYHSRRQPGMWAVEKDSSVTRGNRGGEVISPILKDSRETWEQLEKICAIIKEHGGKINSKCGGHIHIGAEPLDARSYRWTRLLKIFGGFEDVLYRMASGGQSRGEFRGTHYAAPIASIIPSNFFRNRQTDETEIKQHVRNRYHGLNFQNANPGLDKNTVEFRLWNGSLDPRQIQANVKMSMGIVHAADNVRRTNERTRERNELIPSGPMKYGQAVATGKDPEDHTEIRRLLDLLFIKNQDKAAALWLYASSKWQS